ncbi:MAG: RDD family protein [Cyanobacteria bacterium P01_F01_bin.143]
MVKPGEDKKKGANNQTPSDNQELDFRKRYQEKLKKSDDLIDQILDQMLAPETLKIKEQNVSLNEQSNLNQEEITPRQQQYFAKTRHLEQQKQQEKEKYENKLKQYKREFIKAIQTGYPLKKYVRDGLNNYQRTLGLTNEDINRIEKPIICQKEKAKKQKEQEYHRFSNTRSNEYVEVINDRVKPSKKIRTSSNFQEIVDYADLMQRILAFLVDVLFCFMGLLIFSYLITDDIIVWIYSIILYHLILIPEILWGKTLGKKIMGITITDLRGNRVIFHMLFLRFLSKYISFSFLGIGIIIYCISISNSQKKQATHDHWAKSVVVTTNSLRRFKQTKI